uniref:Uncharacterized protein n=1 Tax=Anguilla anguilla TaxID=7936 RepID=A0A0E9XY60_ANGAN
MLRHLVNFFTASDIHGDASNPTP